jgi:hypothetical protein
LEVFAMPTLDEKNYEWFKNNLPILMESHEGKFLIIHNESLCGAYPSFSDALGEALKIAKPGEFLIQRCVDEKEGAQVICSLMRLPNFS